MIARTDEAAEFGRRIQQELEASRTPESRDPFGWTFYVDQFTGACKTAPSRPIMLVDLARMKVRPQ